MSPAPFFLRRPALLVRDLLADRERPDLDALGRIEDPERFVWAILPHAARTFSACIALLPAASARAAAVAYLYCRILDTYEDLSPDVDRTVAALHAFAARFEADSLPPAPPLGDDRTVDARDRAHVLLVRRCDRVDALYATLPPGVRAIIADLVSAMAAGMAWAARAFHDQGGLLRGDAQLVRYCRAVLGQPVLFVARMVHLSETGDATLPPADAETAMLAGEFIQLANVTRDVEKDLARGVAYRPSLAPRLGARVPRPGEPAPDDATAAAMHDVARARAELLDLALARAPAYDRLIDQLDRSVWSLTRASALLMLLFTERYDEARAERGGRPRAAPPASGLGLLAATVPAVLSRRWTAARRRAALARLARLGPAPSDG